MTTRNESRQRVYVCVSQNREFCSVHELSNVTFSDIDKDETSFVRSPLLLGLSSSFPLVVPAL